MPQTSVSVIIPAYNEEKTIGNVIKETISIMDGQLMPYEVIVVNDGSTDQTGQVASKHKARVLSNEKNRGKGYSIRKALEQAQGDIIITIDSDGEHNPKEIPDLLDPVLGGIDVVSGSRFMSENKYAGRDHLQPDQLDTQGPPCHWHTGHILYSIHPAEQ